MVYGDAWPLIREWRTLWAVHSPMGKGLAWASRRQRILELEVAMLEEHGLTLTSGDRAAAGPGPEGADLLAGAGAGDGSGRRRARLELLRWVRRVLTLGLWRD